jgi:hypothetical protein
VGRALFAGGGDAAIVADAPLESLIIDGYALARLDVARVELPAGEHEIAARIRDRGEVRLTRSLAASESLSIGETFAPIVSPAPEEGPPVLPAVTVGLGAAGLAAGTALVILAKNDRATVQHAARNEEGLIVGLTYPEAKRLEARADDRATAGAIALSAGAAVVAAGVLWWFLE